MLCQHCEKEQVTTTVIQTVAETKHQLNLCSDCASKLGYLQSFSGVFGDFPSFSSVFSGVHPFFVFSGNGALPSQQNKQSARVCPGCQSAFSEIARSGRVGCARCYSEFASELQGVIRRMHPSAIHSGKRPCTDSKNNQSASAKTSLQARLQEAVTNEQFELAAMLRDEIKRGEANFGNEKSPV